MTTNERISLIHLLSKELCDTASQYEQEKEETSYPTRGYGSVTSDNCRTTLKRRITTLRAELLELSKSL